MENVTPLYGVEISRHEQKIIHDALDMIDNIVTERLLIMKRMRISNKVDFYDLLSREIADLFDEAWHRYFKLISQEVNHV